MLTAALLLIIAGAGEAEAPPDRPLVMVMTLRGAALPSVDALAKRTLDFRLGLRLVSGERGEVQALAEEIRRCGAETECVKTRLGAAGVERAILMGGALERSPALLAAQLVGVDEGVIAQGLRELSGSRDVTDQMVELIDELLDHSGAPRAARLTVSTAPPAAAVTLDPPAVPLAAAGTYRLPAGRYHLVARLDGFEGAEAEVTLIAGREDTVAFHLQPDDRSLASSPWFWATVVGAAMLAGGAAIAVEAAQPDRCLCLGTDREQCGDCR
ncbi:MAG: carboxypeptidase regulatory-like domain-containing protein [Deltaproteobacteria bacterium]|nr:carboxypeptidase regulatory-like domain-containing protein [Deltaproteobacteria bacterium]